MADEFIDTFSDDMIRLRQAWKIMGEQPGLITAITEASLTRIAIVFGAASLEGMMKHWREKWGADSTWRMALEPPKKLSIEARVERLHQDVCARGVAADREIIADYMAIKLMRNRIVHSEAREGPVAFIESRGFPRDVRRLTGAHWQRVLHIEEQMMVYIALSGIRPRQRKSDAKHLGG